MAADTKNKKGRPPKHSGIYAIFPEKEKRAAANLYFAVYFIDAVMKEKPGDKGNFFITEKGNVRRQGIAEQLGRMLEAGEITAGEAKNLAEWAIDTYNTGGSVKNIVNALRLYRRAR